MNYVCTACDKPYTKKEGRCAECGGWNTIEELPADLKPARKRAGKGVPSALPGAVGGPERSGPVRLGDVDTASFDRFPSGLEEFDVVLGGGLVPGSVLLLSGPPGSGKSTLLTQVAKAQAAGDAARCLYVAGEESIRQTRMRTERLGGGGDNLLISGSTNVHSIVREAHDAGVSLLIVDSLHTLHHPDSEGAPAGVKQMNSCAEALRAFAKQTDTAVLLVGHVTQDNTIAGPKVIEHMVDAVLRMDPMGDSDVRVIRCSGKNRFGANDESGFFRMTSQGLVELKNPSEDFLYLYDRCVSGVAVTPVLEGTRPVLLEVQALVSPCRPGTGQRLAIGLDRRRLSILLAVLERHLGLPAFQLNVVVKVAAGVQVSEPAVDAAVAAAILSSAADAPLPDRHVVWGEIGLSGELRPTPRSARRLQVAHRMGFERATHPALPPSEEAEQPEGIRGTVVADVRDFAQQLFGSLAGTDGAFASSVRAADADASGSPATPSEPSPPSSAQGVYETVGGEDA